MISPNGRLLPDLRRLKRRARAAVERGVQSFASIFEETLGRTRGRRPLPRDCRVEDAVRAGFMGWAAAVEPKTVEHDHLHDDAEIPECLRDLGLGAGATRADVKRAFRRHALRAHPDRGGSARAFRHLMATYDAALHHVSER